MSLDWFSESPATGEMGSGAATAEAGASGSLPGAVRLSADVSAALLPSCEICALICVRMV